MERRLAASSDVELEVLACADALLMPWLQTRARSTLALCRANAYRWLGCQQVLCLPFYIEPAGICDLTDFTCQSCVPHGGAKPGFFSAF